MDPNMMANMPAQPPMMPQGMQSNVDPRMLAQQPPMARMGGLLRRFASGRSLDDDFIKAMGEDPKSISMAKYNEITSPQFQANQLGYNYATMGGTDFKGLFGVRPALTNARRNKIEFVRSAKNQNLSKEEFESQLAVLEQDIVRAESLVSDRDNDISSEGELENLIGQGLLRNNPEYFELSKIAGTRDDGSPNTSKLLELIKMSEGSKIDEDTTASLDANRQNIIDVGAGSGGAGTGDGASGQGDDANPVDSTTGGGVTIANAVAGSRVGDSNTIIKNAQTDANITNFAKTKGTTLSGFAGDTRIRTDLDKAIIAKDKIDNNTLLSYQKDLDDAETALNKISETDFPSRDEIISKNKQQIKLGMAQAFFNAAGSGKPSFMEAMGESLGAASGVMQKGTAKEQKDLMQLAIADYNRAAKKYDIADKRRSTLSAQITTKLANRQTREDKLTDQRFKLQERIDKKDEKIADMITDKIDAKEATRRWEAEQSIDVNKNFQAFFEDLRSDQFANTTMNSQEMEGYAAIQMGNVAMKYGSRPQTVALKGIERFTNEIPKIAKRLRSKDPSLSNQASIEAAKKEYRDFLIGGEELGSAAIFDHFDPIITKYQEDLIKFPNSKAANSAYMKDEFSWLPTAYYDED